MTPIKTVIPTAQFPALVHPMFGKQISRVWRGHGSAIFLELGELKEWHYQTKKGERTYMVGEFTIWLSWSWRVESVRGIKFGSWSTNRVITNQLRQLEGKFIVGIELFGRLPEIQVSISEGLWLSSFMTSSGQPEWCLCLATHRLHVERGSIVSMPND